MEILDELRVRLEKNPSATVNLIVRTQDDPRNHAAHLESRGITIRHTYSLISGIAIQAAASDALALAREPWVISMEEDKVVHTL
ncbi:MAG: protease inhibitor I9 family protein [Chloroflexi bacterium]|nr:protease inhibitor I9 family protein [Chloroflexota bacterium]